MLLDIDDVDKLFKNIDCYGAVLTTTVTAGSAAAAGGAVVGSSVAMMSGAAAVMANVALASSIIGTGLAVKGSIDQGKQAANQAQFQAQVAQNDAIIAGQQRDRAIKTAASNEEDYRRQQSELFGSRNALLGKTGVQRGAGSPLAVSTDFAGESELNALRLRNEGDVNANRLQQSVLNKQSQAGLFATKARNERTNTFTRAGGELFSGIGRTASSFR